MASGEGGPSSFEDVRRQIERSRRLYIEAMKRGDSTRLASHFAEAGVLLPERAPAVRGRPAIERWFQSWLPSAKVTEFEVVSEELHVIQNVAVEVGRHRMVIQFGEADPVEDEGKFLMVYEKGVDGEWLISKDMFSSNRPRPG
jgi:ketosteroid isomerase-like protein